MTTLILWLLHRTERRAFDAGGNHTFRWPWSRLLSVREARGIEVFRQIEAQVKAAQERIGERGR